MRIFIATQDTEVKRIDAADISRLTIYPEEYTGDGEYDRINYWTLYAHLYSGTTVKLFEAKGFDSDKKIFYARNAVKGKNYNRVLEAKEQVEQAIAKVVGAVVVVSL